MSVVGELNLIGQQIIAFIPSLIEFLIVILIGYIIAGIVTRVLRVFLSRMFREAHIQMTLDIILGTIKALIIIIALSIGLDLLNVPPQAAAYVTTIANYLPELAGAILLLTIGMTLVNVLVDYIQKQTAQEQKEEPFLNAIFNILKFGLYAVIITLAVNLAILSVIPGVNPYLFFSIIIGSVILYASFTIINTVLNGLGKEHPEMGFLVGYGKFILYTVFLLVGIGVIIQPFGNVTSILNTLAYGLVIAFAIAIIPMTIYIVKMFLKEMK